VRVKEDVFGFEIAIDNPPLVVEIIESHDDLEEDAPSRGLREPFVCGDVVEKIAVGNEINGEIKCRSSSTTSQNEAMKGFSLKHLKFALIVDVGFLGGFEGNRYHGLHMLSFVNSGEGTTGIPITNPTKKIRRRWM
jgi:hypothetical protein